MSLKGPVNIDNKDIETQADYLISFQFKWLSMHD